MKLFFIDNRKCTPKLKGLMSSQFKKIIFDIFLNISKNKIENDKK